MELPITCSVNKKKQQQKQHFIHFPPANLQAKLPRLLPQKIPKDTETAVQFHLLILPLYKIWQEKCQFVSFIALLLYDVDMSTGSFTETRTISQMQQVSWWHWLQGIVYIRAAMIVEPFLRMEKPSSYIEVSSILLGIVVILASVKLEMLN